MQTAAATVTITATTRDNVKVVHRLRQVDVLNGNPAIALTSFSFRANFGDLSPDAGPYKVLEGTLSFSDNSGSSTSTPVDAICKVEFELDGVGSDSDSDEDSDEEADEDSDEEAADKDSDEADEVPAPPTLRKEANFYERQLKTLQGRVVPRLYGYFERTNEYSVASGEATMDASSRMKGIEESDVVGAKESGVPNIVACLILQYCGTPLEGKLEDIGSSNGDDIVEALRAIHVAGLSTPLFSIFNNIVKDDAGKIWIVGLSKAREGHDCRLTQLFHKHSLDDKGRWKDFGCKDLYETALILGWLTPGMLKAAGQRINLISSRTLEDMKNRFITQPYTAVRDDGETTCLITRTYNQPLLDDQLADLERQLGKYIRVYGQRDPALVLKSHPELAKKKLWPPTLTKDDTKHGSASVSAVSSGRA